VSSGITAFSEAHSQAGSIGVFLRASACSAPRFSIIASSKGCQALVIGIFVFRPF
jgi:hypothetical protein